MTLAIAGCTGDATSSISTKAVRRRSPTRRWNGSRHSMPSRAGSAAAAPRNAAPSDRPRRSRWSKSSRLGSRPGWSRYRRRAPSRTAIRYGFDHWDGLVRFLDDGRIEMDTNSVERSMRPIALNRKNSLFAGHDEGAVNWACLASLIETAKIHGIDPQAYLADTLAKLVNGWPMQKLDELLPWTWADQNRARLAA